MKKNPNIFQIKIRGIFIYQKIKTEHPKLFQIKLTENNNNNNLQTVLSENNNNLQTVMSKNNYHLQTIL